VFAQQGPCSRAEPSSSCCAVLCCVLWYPAGGEVDYSEHIAPLRAASPPSMRCVLVSATLPQHTFDELQDLFMGLGAAFGPGLHRTAQGGQADSNRGLSELSRQQVMTCPCSV